MTEIQRLRRLLSVERAHRMQLESNIEILIELLADTREPAINTQASLRHLLRAVQAGGRHARQLDVRYRAVVQEHAGPVEALQRSEVPGLLGEASKLSLPGFIEWLSEQRPDLAQVIRDARVGPDPDRNPSCDVLPGE
ncbi:hypothetical protein [Lichenicoccus roseus]|uniref:Uncharacterized protein n=1 Tax=Lichenicoccus roseus TaxID=2683649 RepID=A0A5R9J0H8_9PROT|nr:hypothetical protein [Lichenicoccus roseus]TLU71165.1 hypothetical protein FE263_18520 [Lichenicoccus roseus]